MEKLKSLMQLMIYQHYWQLFFKNDNFKYTTISQRLTLILSRFCTFFISSFSFLLSLFKFSSTKKPHVYNLFHISYTLSSCYVHSARNCIGRRFLKDCFYCYSQKIIYAVTNISLIPHNIIKWWQKHRAFDTVTPNSNTSQIKKI